MSDPGTLARQKVAEQKTEWPKPKHPRMAREANRIRTKFFQAIMRGEKGISR